MNDLESWNVSNGNNFNYMFSKCYSLIDIKEFGMYQTDIILVLCSMDVHH